MEAVRGENIIYAACLLPIGSRADFNGNIRKHMNTRRVSLAPLPFVLEQTGMEYGSITIVGLPKDWLIFINKSFLGQEWVIVGSGKISDKLRLPLGMIVSLPNANMVQCQKQE